MKKFKLALITNMYPTKEFPNIGSFMPSVVKGYEKTGLFSKIDLIFLKRRKGLVGKLYSYLEFYLKVIKKLLTDRYNLIHISYPSHSFAPVFILLPLLKLRNTKLLTRIHGNDFVYEQYQNKIVFDFLFIFTHFSIKFSDMILVPSEYFKNLVLKKYKDVKVYVYPSGGVDLSLFKYKEKDFNKKIFDIGYVGRLDPMKGAEILIKAFAMLRVPHKRLHIVGSGSLEPQLKKMVKELNLEDSVKFYGFINRKKLFKFYQLFDILVFPTCRPAESFGNVVLESLACGTPVIATTIGGAAKDCIIEGYNGFLVPPFNEKAIAEKLKRFYYFPKSKKKEISENAYKTAQKYTIENLSKSFKIQLLTLFESHEKENR